MAKGIGTGGSIERDLVRRYARRRLKLYGGTSDNGPRELRALIRWLNRQPKRTARKGGLGRR